MVSLDELHHSLNLMGKRPPSAPIFFSQLEANSDRPIPAEYYELISEGSSIEIGFTDSEGNEHEVRMGSRALCLCQQSV